MPCTRDYRSGFRVEGLKLILDGSLQGRTAWVSVSYEEGSPGAPFDYVAYGVMEPDEYKAQADQWINVGVPIIVHANGGAAMDLTLDGVFEAVAIVDPPPDHRSVIIHAQLMRADQLDRASELNFVPSFFARRTPSSGVTANRRRASFRWVHRVRASVPGPTRCRVGCVLRTDFST